MVVEEGHGSPVVLVPGIQGRWEWMIPAVRSLASLHRVLTFSLGDVDEPVMFDGWTRHIDELVDRSAAPAAALVGISFGGLVAACYAARRPERVSHLVLVSTPSPTYRLDPRRARYARRPMLSLPFFAANAARCLAPEIMAGLPDWRSRAAFAVAHGTRTVRWPMSPPRMAAWVREWMNTDLRAELCRVCAPSLVLTGEPSLDRVVPVASSLELLTLLPHAEHRILPGTGHLGFLMKPDLFAREVTRFISSSS